VLSTLEIAIALTDPDRRISVGEIALVTTVDFQFARNPLRNDAECGDDFLQTG
jgi:hypothetical protein